MNRLAILFSVIIFTTCQGQVKTNNSVNDSEIIKTSNVQKEVIYKDKMVIIYNPNSVKLEILEQTKSPEALSAIEYDKMLAVEFLTEKQINYEVLSDSIYSFQKIGEKIIKVDISEFQNWGIILFKPEKSPKVIFLNEIMDEFDAYFQE